jgi:hypothetical protein
LIIEELQDLFAERDDLNQLFEEENYDIHSY